MSNKLTSILHESMMEIVLVFCTLAAYVFVMYSLWRAFK